MITCFVLSCLSELLTLLFTQLRCFLDDLICIAVAHQKHRHPPCMGDNYIFNYGRLKECFKLNSGSVHWEISSYLNSAVHLDVFVYARLHLLSMLIAIFSLLERRR